MSDEKRKTITLSGNFIEITQDETDSEIQTDFETKPLTVKTNDIKKGTKIKSDQLGIQVNGIMADNNGLNISGNQKFTTNRSDYLKLYPPQEV